MKNTILEKFKEDLENKKIAIWGLGKEGESTLHFLQNNIKCKEIAVLEKRNIKVSGVTRLEKEEELNNYELIFKSPGIVVNNEKICKEKITSQTEEFIKILRNQIIGITGTKGKSTTSSLIYTILKKYYSNTVLVGNIGVPCFNAINEINEDTKIVFELSCHQLEYIKYSPHIAVIINLYPEHLDHYKNFENYVKAKFNIHKFQKEGDIFIYGKTCMAYVTNNITTDICIDDYIENRTIKIDDNQIEILDSDTNLIGQHNFYDIAISYYICNKIYRISNEIFKTALKQFKGLPHRLEYVATENGIMYYDDSISTIGETTIEGIKALKNVNTLILGGMDRKIDYSELEEFILAHVEVENIILMPETGKRIFAEIKEKENRISNSRSDSIKKKYYLVNNLEEAVKKAKEVTKKNTICLLSPAAASYGFFKNFEERGNRFKELI